MGIYNFSKCLWLSIALPRSVCVTFVYTAPFFEKKTQISSHVLIALLEFCKNISRRIADDFSFCVFFLFFDSFSISLQWFRFSICFRSLRQFWYAFSSLHLRCAWCVFEKGKNRQPFIVQNSSIRSPLGNRWQSSKKLESCDCEKLRGLKSWAVRIPISSRSNSNHSLFSKKKNFIDRNGCLHCNFFEKFSKKLITISFFVFRVGIYFTKFNAFLLDGKMIPY